MSGTALTAPIRELARAVRDEAAQPEALLAASGAALREADRGVQPVHAFLAVDYEIATRRAAELRDRSGWRDLPLAGIPVAVKDNFATLDFPTTCGSLVLEGYRSPYEATAVRRLREAGAIVVGKTNLDEFAMGSSTEHSAYGVTRNPLDRSRVPGGSSGGSAAAVAAGVVAAALGSDTGGSVRQPAAFCGLVGLKPTYGRVSRYGLVAFASSLDTVGVIGRTVADAARVLEVVSGPDPLDATSARVAPPALAALGEDGLGGVVVGIPGEYFPSGLDAGVAERCRAAMASMERLGAELREISLPSTPHALPAYHVLSFAEASSNLARYDGVHFGVRPAGAHSLDAVYQSTRARLGAEVRRRVVLGTYVLSAGHYEEHHARAARVRRRVAEDFRGAFASGVNLIFTPTAPTPAFALGSRTADCNEMYRSDLFTVAANLAGLPALSLPVGTVGGLPVGGQLIGPPWAEATLLRAARALEGALAGRVNFES